MLEELEGQVGEVKQKALERRKREVRDEAAVASLLEEARKEGVGMRFMDEKGKAVGKREVGAVVGDENDEMDLDGGMGKSRGAKRGGSGGGIKGAAKRMMG